jgi:hypothetical protein
MPRWRAGRFDLTAAFGQHHVGEPSRPSVDAGRLITLRVPADLVAGTSLVLLVTIDNRERSTEVGAP